MIAIGFVVFGLFQVGSLAAYAFFVFDVRFTCERARDVCEVEHAKPLWREVSERFRPSQVVEAKYQPGRRACVRVEMKAGAPEIMICVAAGEEYASWLNDFIANPAQDRVEYVVKSNPFDYILVGLLQFFSLIPLYGASSEAIRRLRAAA